MDGKKIDNNTKELIGSISINEIDNIVDVLNEIFAK